MVRKKTIYNILTKAVESNKCKSIPHKIQNLIELYKTNKEEFNTHFNYQKADLSHKLYSEMLDEKHSTNFNDEEESAMMEWKSEGYWHINDYFYNKDEFQEDVDTHRVSETRIKETIENLDKCFEKLSGIPQPMTNSRGGHWNEKWVEGYTGVWMGYTASSYGTGGGSNWTDWEAGKENQTRYNIELYSVKGTKAIAFSTEDEILYSRRLNFHVLETDNKNKTAKVLVW